jgi:hypothetical protein
MVKNIEFIILFYLSFNRREETQGNATSAVLGVQCAAS